MPSTAHPRKIRVLAPVIAERIAAGEVIERPSSVVKELVENALDARSSEIIVTLENGGKQLIEVLDNGEGMDSEDLELSIERHATSKLNSLDDLDRIATLGFRGEALPSVAAVSELSILSRTGDSESARLLQVGDISGRLSGKVLKSEKFTFGQFIDSKSGTRVQVQSLFAQIPARLKFLKSQAAEVSQVREILDRLAIAFPRVGFKLVSDKRTIINYRPESEEKRVQSVLLSEGEEYPVKTIQTENDGFRDLGLKARVYWLQGLSSPNSRKLIQIVNSRVVKDRMLQQALLAPFRQSLLPGQFPALCLFLDVNPAAIDVNVHPTKSEVRFLNGQKIFQVIEQLTKKLLIQEGTPAVTPTRVLPPWEPQTSHFHRTVSNFGTEKFGAEKVSPSLLWPAAEPTSSPITASEVSPFQFSDRDLQSDNQRLEQLEPTPTPPSSHLLSASRLIGSLFLTYLLFENPDELILVDQHAAHERIRYEKIRARIMQSENPSACSQALLLPETVRTSREFRTLLEERLPLLAPYGFDAEVFGENTVLFRAVPVEWGTAQLRTRLINLIDRVIHMESGHSQNSSNAIIMDEQLFEAIASEACHSAVRAGDPLEISEMEDLIRQLFRCEHPWNCPHGRPTLTRIPKGKVEEWFHRKI